MRTSTPSSKPPDREQFVVSKEPRLYVCKGILCHPITKHMVLLHATLIAKVAALPISRPWTALHQRQPNATAPPASVPLSFLMVPASRGTDGQ